MTGAARIEPVQDIVFSHFADRVGKDFHVAAGDHRLTFHLETAQDLPGSPRPGGAFRLEFVGPVEPMFEQGILPFEIDGERFEIFVVPIARDANGTRYEAVFF